MENDRIEQALIKSNFSHGSVTWGVVGLVDGKVYRLLKRKSLIDNIDKFKSMQKELESIGLIKTKYHGKTSSGNYIVSHEKFEHQTVMYEWTKEQIRDIVIMTLRLLARLMQDGFYLADARLPNATFVGLSPVFFDFDSISFGKPNVTRLLEIFWKGRFSPVAGAGFWLGLNKAEMDTLIYSVKEFEKAFAFNIITVNKLEFEYTKTSWTAYKQAIPDGMDISSPETHSGKYGDATRMFEKHNLKDQVRTVLDIGASRGVFVECMLANGVEKVVALDVDEGIIANVYKKAKKEKLPITCGYISIMEYYGLEQKTPVIWDRLNCDLVLCIALVHHLCYFKELTFEEVAKRLWAFTNKYLMIEWIPYTDKFLTGKINKFGVNKAEYTENNFISAFSELFEIIDVAKMTPHPRKVFLLKSR